jgi:hypothetical protein
MGGEVNNNACKVKGAGVKILDVSRDYSTLNRLIGGGKRRLYSTL